MPAQVKYVSPSHIDVELGGRVVRVEGEAHLPRPEAPYFVFSNSIRAFQPPHASDPLSDEDRAAVLDAIRAHLEARKTAYVIDPTDEQYRTL
jgi:hypothetical protein